MKDAFDAVVIGAGINGCAIARKLSLEGKRVLLLEKGTVGCGTSSNSSKRVHGGSRYLENFQFSLVKESLLERRRLCELYPDLVQMVPFYLPVYSDSPRPWWMIRAGLAMYDFYSHQDDFRCRLVRFTDFANHFPEVNLEKLEKVYVYYDGKTDDLELTRRIAEDAVDKGCSLIEEACLTDISLGENEIKLQYMKGRVMQQASTPVLINAAGPWIDEVNDQFGLEHNYRIKGERCAYSHRQESGPGLYASAD